MAVLEFLTEQLAGEKLKTLGKSLGLGEETVNVAVKTALPVLVSALAKNTQKEGGAESLDRALDRDHDGSILDTLKEHLSNPNLTAGDGILGHVLGNRRGAMEQGIGEEVGVDKGVVGKLLSTLAPVVMGALGREKKQKGMDLVAIAQMLDVDYQKQLEENQQKKSSSPFAKLMDMVDQDDDGSVTDELAGALGGLFGKK